MQTLQNITRSASVLIVEDDEALLKTTVELLENFFTTIVTATNGQEALEVFYDFYQSRKRYVDIVITDIHMPELDGVSFIKELKTLNRYQNVIVLSAYDDKERLIEFINLGVKGFLQKPLQLSKFIESVTNVLEEDPSRKERTIRLRENFSFVPENQTLKENETEIRLTKNEAKLLSLLLQKPKWVFSSIEIFEYLYEDTRYFSEDSIKALIKRLRKKLPEDTLMNKKGEGYYIQTA